jgi:hypothetical protein
MSRCTRLCPHHSHARPMEACHASSHVHPPSYWTTLASNTRSNTMPITFTTPCPKTMKRPPIGEVNLYCGVTLQWNYKTRTLDLLMPNKEAIIVHTILAKIGHPQPATPMQVDNSTTNGILNGTIKQKRSCTMLMFFYWMRDRTKQGQFHVFWAPGSDKLANYFTKHHSLRYHCLMHPSYLHG